PPEEQAHVLAEADDVAVAQPAGMIHALAAHERAVLAAQVLYEDGVPAHQDARVGTRHADRREGDGRFLGAAQDVAALVELPLALAVAQPAAPDGPDDARRSRGSGPRAGAGDRCELAHAAQGYSRAGAARNERLAKPPSWAEDSSASTPVELS